MMAAARYASERDVHDLRMQVGVLWICFGLAIFAVGLSFARRDRR